jgi:hypothetical protein
VDVLRAAREHASAVAGGTSLVGDLERAFETARSREERQPVSFSLAGRTIAITFASGRLEERMTRSLQHLRVPEDAARPDLRLHVWESARHDLPPPPVPELARSGDDEEALYHFGDDDVEGVYQRGPRALSVIDRRSAHAWYWIADEDDVSYIEAAKPFRLVLNWWLGERDLQIVHGGAIADEGRGALLVGKSGSGKSTTTLAALADGFDYAGDDYVVAGATPEPWVHALYAVGKLEESHAERLPTLTAAVDSVEWTPGEKKVLFVDEAFPGRVPRDGFRLSAIVVPHIGDTLQSSHRPASRIAALGALAPSTLFELPGQARVSLARMTRLVSRVPVYQLECGRDVSTIPDALRRLLAEAE